jgi:tRNA U34 2-thiouridine synthase MnmA/TrmU
MPVKCVAMMSGGLDSTLAARLMKELGFDVVGVNFYNGFCVEVVHRQIDGAKGCYTPLAAAHAIGINLEFIDVAEPYMDVVKYPKHGRGAAMNPCIDCRIFMLRRAGEFMQKTGAEFVVTGEVLDQRPMSQHYRAMTQIQEECGLGDRLVRPLSGRLLPETYPVLRGYLRQDQLLDIRGRSRERQMQLAAEWEITKYSQPAGGCCLLVDLHFGQKLRDSFKFKGKGQMIRRDFEVLKVGRHFRLSPTAKVIVGRNEQENEYLKRFSSLGWTITTPDVMGPTTLVEGQPTREELEWAARLCARYSDGRGASQVRTLVSKNGETYEMIVSPLDPGDAAIARTRIGA